MALTVDQFILDFPQFANTDEDVIESFFVTAAAMASADAWGGLADRAQGLLSAHMLALMEQASLSGGRNTGNLTGVSIPNEVSYQFAQTASFGDKGSEGLKSTIYGQEYLQLQKFVFLPFRIV